MRGVVVGMPSYKSGSLEGILTHCQAIQIFLRPPSGLGNTGLPGIPGCRTCLLCSAAAGFIRNTASSDDFTKVNDDATRI